MNTTESKINNFKKIFGSWENGGIMKFPKMEIGDLCPQCGVNHCIIVNGQKFKCPTCESANHVGALHDSYKFNADFMNNDGKARQYKD